MAHHADHIEGYSLESLAEAMGDLRYDTLSELLYQLKCKLNKDSDADEGRGRPKLAKCLSEAAWSLGQASIELDKAWEICRPFMEDTDD